MSSDMYIPKKYGYSQSKTCPFCNRNATTKNKQKIPVCEKHRTEKFPDVRCSCKSFLDLKDGQYGPYFFCMKCGNKSFQSVLELMQLTGQKIHQPQNDTKSPQKTETYKTTTRSPKEIIISSDDVEWFS